METFFGGKVLMRLLRCMLISGYSAEVHLEKQRFANTFDSTQNGFDSLPAASDLSRDKSANRYHPWI